ncbi:MAG: hypothetical protein J5I94_27295 [Phaeodactylibacter sp.]|nr:hypothetical protein [Phaeodactylibacter sp.]
MIIGIGGVSRSGKTTLAKRLARHFRRQGLSAVILHQDDFVFPEEQIPKIRGKTDWEHPGSIDFERFRQAIRSNANTHDIVIAEGLMALYDEGANALYDKCFFVEISRETFLERKSQDLRWGKEPDWYIIRIWDSFQQYGQPRQPLPEILVVNGEETAVDWDAVLKFLNFS